MYFVDKVPAVYHPVTHEPLVREQLPLLYNSQYGVIPQGAIPAVAHSQSQPSGGSNSWFLVYYKPKQLKNGVEQPESSVQPAPLSPTPVHYSPSTHSQTIPSNFCTKEGILPHPTDCLKYVRCRLNAKQQFYYYEIRSCPMGLAWDQTIETCNYHGRVSRCASAQSYRPTLANSYGHPGHLYTSTGAAIPSSNMLNYAPAKETKVESAQNAPMYLDFPFTLSSVSIFTKKRYFELISYSIF